MGLVDARTTTAVLGLELGAVALGLAAGGLAGLLGEDEIHGEECDEKMTRKMKMMKVNMKMMNMKMTWRGRRGR